MKKLLILASFALSVSANAAELRFFVNYDPANDSYDYKYSSTSARPLSAEHLLGATTGACYKGDPLAVRDLMVSMVRIYHTRIRYAPAPALRVNHMSFDTWVRPQDGKTQLRAYFYLDDGSVQEWPRIRPCVNPKPRCNCGEPQPPRGEYPSDPTYPADNEIVNPAQDEYGNQIERRPAPATVPQPAPIIVPVPQPAPVIVPVRPPTVRVEEAPVRAPAPAAPVVRAPAPVVHAPAPAPIVREPAPAPVVHAPAPVRVPAPAPVVSAPAETGAPRSSQAPVIPTPTRPNVTPAKPARAPAPANGGFDPYGQLESDPATN